MVGGAGWKGSSGRMEWVGWMLASRWWEGLDEKVLVVGWSGWGN